MISVSSPSGAFCSLAKYVVLQSLCDTACTSAGMLISWSVQCNYLTIVKKSIVQVVELEAVESSSVVYNKRVCHISRSPIYRHLDMVVLYEQTVLC